MVAVSRRQSLTSTGLTCRLVSGATQRLPRCFILIHIIVYDPSLNLTVVFHPSSDLPYIVRSIEDHSIYGASTNDLYLTNYKAVNGLMFPHCIQTVYNSSQQFLDATLEDYIIEQVDVDPEFPSNFFDGLAVNESMTPKAAPMKVPGVSHARITEFQSNMLWGGITHSDVDELQVQQPVPDLPTVHWLVLDNDTLGVKQLIIEFDTEVIVGDAPPQWTSSVIQWVAQNLKKPITHLWVSPQSPKLPSHRFQCRFDYLLMPPKNSPRTTTATTAAEQTSTSPWGPSSSCPRWPPGTGRASPARSSSRSTTRTPTSTPTAAYRPGSCGSRRRRTRPTGRTASSPPGGPRPTRPWPCSRRTCGRLACLPSSRTRL